MIPSYVMDSGNSIPTVQIIISTLPLNSNLFSFRFPVLIFVVAVLESGGSAKKDGTLVAMKCMTH